MNLLLFAKKKLTAGIALALNFTGETLDSRVSFSRTSNATRVNAQGLIEYAPHNLLTYSENFDNAVWSKSGGEAVGANLITAPDGNTTADKLMVGSSVFAQTVQTQTTTVSNIHTASIYLCENEIRYVQIRLRNSAAISNYVRTLIDLNTGALYLTGSSGNGSGAVASAVKVGNFWRLSLSGTADTTGTLLSLVVILCKDTAGTVAGTANSLATDGAYIWGAQLNIGSLQPYYTTSVKNLLGYTQNFENAAWTKSNSSVLTNLLTYSQEFENAVWGKTNATVTANAVVAPDGTITADTVTDSSDGVAAAHVVGSANISFVIGTAYTVSIYAKQGTLPGVSLLFPSAAFTSTLNARFNLSTGVIANLDAGLTGSITDIGNGWYRCSATATATATASNQIQIRTATSTTSFYQGNGSGNIYIWGAQLVQGTNPEEYTVTTSAPAPIQVMGPLGFLGAEKLVENTVNAAHYIRQFPSITTPVAFSVYAKAGERTKFQLDCYDATNGTRNAVFNLVSGTVETILGTGVSANIIALSNGWYRCCMILPTSATGGDCKIALYTTSNSYLGDGTSGIYIFGAQVSDSASLDPYSYNFGAAPTSSAYYGPRFDYDPVTLAPKGLLIEEQRINILLNSDTLSTQSVSVTAQAYTLSFYGTGSVALSGAYTGSLVGTGEYPNRVQLTFTPAIGTLTLTVTGSVRYANLEAGSFPTSYIPTTSTQVTRTADNASMVGTNFSSWYNQSEGTVVAETDVNYPAAVTGYPVSIGVNFNDSLTMYRQSDAQPVLRINTAGVNYYLGAYGNVWSDNLVKKLALGYQANNTSSAYNGLGSATDTTVTLPVATQLSIGSLFNSFSYLNGHIKSFKFFSKRFINTYLQRLTR